MNPEQEPAKEGRISTDGGLDAQSAAADGRNADANELLLSLRWQAGLLDVAPPIIARDLDDRVTYWNPAAEALYGWPAAEALGRITHELLQTRFPRPLERILARVHDCGAWRGDLVHTRADGREITVDSQWTLYRDDAGTVQAIVQVDADITEHKRLQALVADYQETPQARVAEGTVELERLYRQIEATQRVMDRAGFAVIWADAVTSRIVHASRGAADMLGYTEAELLRLSVPDIDPNFRLVDVHRAAQMMQERGVLRFESAARHKDGHVFPTEVNLCALEAPDTGQRMGVSLITDISVRKQAERELERHRHDLEALVAARTAELTEAKTRLEAATEAAGLGVWEWDLTGNSTNWDTRSFEIFGIPADQRRTAPDLAHWLQLVHPEDRPGIAARIPEDIERAGRFQLEYRILLPDGSLRHVKATGQVMRDALGRPQRMVGFHQDVTETKETELALRRSEQRLENILYGTDAGTWDWNLQTDAIVLNERWAAMVGYTLAELTPHTSETWRLLTHPQDLQEAETRLAQCFARESEQYECELRMRHRDGHWVWTLTKGRVVEWTADGQALRMAGIHLDISERKRAELALAEQSERFRRFFQDNGAMMFMVDAESGRIEAANSAAIEFYGYPIERLIGMSIAEIDTLPPEELRRLRMKVLDGRGSVFHLHNRLASGEVRDVEINKTPIRIGDRRMLFAIIHDETARVQAEAELVRAKEAAEAAAQAKGEFLAHMSHEIRTPMNGILGLAELALRRPLEPLARDYLEKLHRSGQHLLDILNDILDQSRIDASQLRLENAPFGVQELLGGLLDLFSEVAAQKGLKLRVSVADDVPLYLLGDAVRLRQVLANLLDNAIKFTEQGEVRLQVTCLGMQDAVARLRWAVTDTGPGIDAADHARLFAPFSQGDQTVSRRHGGTGLGLSISRGLVETMGGVLNLTSTPGVGSTFAVELPLPVAAAPAPRTAAQLGLGHLHGARVLVAEDHPVNRLVIADMLALLGVDATLVGTGREVLDALARERFDAVLMDIQMPEMDGLTATARLREQPAFATLPVIAITAGVTEVERAKVAAAGANALLAKPVRLETLAESLERWLPARAEAQAGPHHLPPRPEPPSAASAAALPPLNGFDSHRLHKVLGHQEAARFVHLFVDSAREDIDAIAHALDAGDAAAARGALHRLRGACACVGAVALQESAAELSEAIKQGAPTAGPLAALRRVCRDAAVELETLIPPAAAGDGE